ncbi:hypothetical protein SAY86_023912 [Trapa natans]|uniref:3-hydroxyacyl-CoA dehydrogenase NAD binding domain-containing protein n=1 Tax=Trapa natans TaxID=22666 RepID=A0AAN7M8C3_TRANT|nr:hypothetical protein SAY86_023912 [Trapa natans]
MAKVGVTLEVGSDGVAVITMRNPPVNALAIPVLDGLQEKIGEAMRRNDVKAVVLIGQGGRFSGGFDINVFAKIHQTGNLNLLPNVSIDLVVNTIEGTQRLPRLVGLPKAISMMLSSKPIMSEEGKSLGLIDAIVPSGELLKASCLWALEIAGRHKPWLRSLHRTDKLPPLSEARKILNNAREQAKKTAKNLPQHQACLDVIEEGIIHGGYSGILRKILARNNYFGHMPHTFAPLQVPNVTDSGLKPRIVKKVAVLGGGLMGSGIATALILGNVNVVLKEINNEYLLKGIKIIEVTTHNSNLSNGDLIWRFTGKNNGKGFYIYEKGSRPRPDPSILPIVEESRRLANIMPHGKPLSVSDQEILEMILFPVVNESCRVLDEGVVVQASDLDIASVLGMSFPSYR